MNGRQKAHNMWWVNSEGQTHRFESHNLCFFSFDSYKLLSQENTGNGDVFLRNESTTLRTSPRHQTPLGFLVLHWHPPFFFSAMILSMMVDLPLLSMSFRMSSVV